MPRGGARPGSGAKKKMQSTPPGFRWCPHCRAHKPEDEFGKDRHGRGGRYGWCKSCLSSSRRTDLRRMVRYGYQSHLSSARISGWQPLASLFEYEAIVSKGCVFGDGRIPEVHVGIDRIDSTLSYPGNAQGACRFHNCLKSGFDDDLFRIFLQRHPELRKCSDSIFRHEFRRLKLPPAKPVRPEWPMPLFDSVQ